LSILLQHAPATSELILVDLSTRKALLEHLDWIDPGPSGSVAAPSAAVVPFALTSTLVVTVVGTELVAVGTTRTFVLMPVSPVLGTGPDA
jgi:hypothetical protein